MELIIITVGAIMALAATVVLAAWRTITRPASSERFEDALNRLLKSDEAEIDTTLAKTVKTDKWNWSRFWYDTVVKTGRVVSDQQGPGRFMGGLAAVAMFFGIAVFPGGVQGLLVAPLTVLGAAYVWLNMEQTKRKHTMEKQLPLLLSGIRAQMSAGLTPQAALLAVADDLPSPIGDEVRQLKADVNVSIPLDQALASLSTRMKSRVMYFLVSSIGIAIRSGADLIPQLITIEEIVRQRSRIDGKIRAALAMARPTSYLAIGVPAIMVVYFFTSDPTYAAYFFGDGILLGLVALGLYVGGIFTIRAMIANVEKI